MIAIWVKVRVKPEKRDELLEAIEVDALGSERDERVATRPGFPADPAYWFPK